MSNQIVEELPSAAPVAGGKEKLEKQARQLAYDVKYKVKQQMNRGTNLDPAAVKKAYLAFLGRASGSPQVKALAKKKLIGEGYIDVDQFVQDSVVNALVKEFGGNNEIKEVKNEYLQQLEESEDRKYKIRVTDKQTGNTYVRMATRAKIAELRANTNIASVEMTGYGEPTSTYSSSPSKAKKDYDGDGKVESPTAEYKGSKDKAIKKAMAKEDFIIDAKGEDSGDKKVEELKKGKKNVVKIMPNIGEDAKYGYDKDGKSLNPDDVKKKNEKDPNGESEKKEEEDYRGMKTKVNLMRNKVRAMGLNMSQEQNGEVIDEAQSSYDKARKAAARRAADRNAQRRAGKLGGRMERETYTSEAGARMHYKGYRANANEELEFELTEEFITERVDHAIEYFFNEGINEEGLDLIIEEVGIDEFTAFVIDGPQELNEDEAAYQKAKKKAISGSDRREREGKGEYSPKGSSSPYAKQGLGAKTKKKPKIGHTGTKVVAATQKAKKAQPAKPASKEGLGSKIRSAVSKGIERHKAATKKVSKTLKTTAKQHSQHRKDFVGGLKATPKERKIAGGIAKAAKKAVVGEEKVLQIINIIKRNRLDETLEKPDKVDKGIESKQKKVDQMKKQVLIKKLQAVRAGGGASVTA